MRRLRPEVPESLEALVLRLLAKDPQHRPASAQEVYEHLALLLPARGMPTGAPLDPTRPFLRPHAPWPDRRPHPRAPADGRPGARTRPTSRGPSTRSKRCSARAASPRPSTSSAGSCPPPPQEHGEHSPVVRILRKQYAATLMDDGQYRRALPELRRLADERAAEAGPADPQALRFRYDAAQCLEQLGRSRGGARRVPRPAALLREPVRRRRPGTRPRRPPPHRPPAARRRRPPRRPRHPRPPPPRRGPPPRPRTPTGGGDQTDTGVAGAGAGVVFAGPRRNFAAPGDPVSRTWGSRRLLCEPHFTSSWKHVS